MFVVCMFVVCERNKMKSINKVSEHFPLWRGAGGGFSINIQYSTLLAKYYPLDYYPLPMLKVRNQKTEIRMNAIIGASTSNIQHSTFQHLFHILLITHHFSPMNKSILVTGATGLVGSYVVRTLLANGYDDNISIIHREKSDMSLLGDAKDKVKSYVADLTDVFGLEDAFEGITHVIHCGALVSFDSRDKERFSEDQY
jgi:hypothetical protein